MNKRQAKKMRKKLIKESRLKITTFTVTDLTHFPKSMKLKPLIIPDGWRDL